MKYLITILKQKGQILEGIANSIFTRQDVEIIAEHRMEICDDCDKIDRKGDACMVPGTKPCCSECGCSLSFKTRSLSSSCPLGKWNAEVTEEEAKQISDLIGTV